MDQALIAKTAFHLVTQHRAARGSAARFFESLIGHLCRELEDFAPRNVSVGAVGEAERLGIGDLRHFHWDDQPGRMSDPDRLIFHWDHVDTVSSLKRALLDGAVLTPRHCTEIVARSRIAWITKEEDRRLTTLGFRSKRPDPDAAYRAAGIELAHPWSECAFG